MRNFSLLLSLPIILMSSVSGEVLFYEGFNYTVGESLDGKKGGDGFSGAWEQLKVNGEDIITRGLSFSNLSKPVVRGIGGSLRITPDLKTKEPDSVAFQRRFKRPISEGEEVWFSSLLRAKKIGIGDCFLWFKSDANTQNFGKRWGGADFTFYPNSKAEGGLKMEEGHTHLLIMKVKGVSDGFEFSLWVDPQKKQLALEPEVKGKMPHANPLHSIGISVQNYGEGVYIFDEFKMATSWEELFSEKALPSNTPIAPKDSEPTGLKELNLAAGGNLKATGNDFLDEELKKAQAAWSQKRERIVSAIEVKFLDTLKEKIKSLVKEGDLVKARAFKNASEGKVGDAEPAELTELRLAASKRKRDAVQPLDKSYWEKLKEIREVFRQEGSLLGVEVLNGEINRILKAYKD